MSNNKVCYFCNGFCSTQTERLVCNLCHDFLYPENQFLNFIQPIKGDPNDDDSGNDEPNEYFNQESKQMGTSNSLDNVVDSYIKMSPEESNSKRQPMDILRVSSSINFPIPNADDANIYCLPPEVLLKIFSFLDDFSLWCAGNVCRQWRDLVLWYTSFTNHWKRVTTYCWPLYKPYIKINNWFDVFTNLVNSSCCISCIERLGTTSRKIKKISTGNTWRHNRLMNELKYWHSDPPEGILAAPLDPGYFNWLATILGPVGSPYEGGNFFLHVQINDKYPMNPPIVRFITKIFHPNVSLHGDVGIDSITYNWTLALTIAKVLLSIQSLLTDPYCDICMEPDIGKLYIEDRDSFNKKAREWTWKYAMSEFIIKTDLNSSI